MSAPARQPVNLTRKAAPAVRLASEPAQAEPPEPDDEPDAPPAQAPAPAAAAPSEGRQAVRRIPQPERPAEDDVPPPVASRLDGSAGLWDLVQAAWQASKDDSRAWDNYTAQLPLALWDRLKAEQVRHFRRTRLKVAYNHFISAAIGQLPLDDDGAINAEAAAEIGLSWHASHPGRESLRPSGSSVTREQKHELELLTMILSGHKPPVLIRDVLAGAISQFLDALDAQHPPE